MRTTLTEIEKFYIQRFSNEKPINKLLEDFAKDYPDIDQNTVKSYILNMPLYEVSHKEEKTPEHVTTIKSKEDLGQFFAARDGTVVLTQAASERSDEIPKKNPGINESMITKLRPDRGFNPLGQRDKQ